MKPAAHALRFVLLLGLIASASAHAAQLETACPAGTTEAWLELPWRGITIYSQGRKVFESPREPVRRALLCAPGNAPPETAFALPRDIDAASERISQIVPSAALLDVLARLDGFLCPRSHEDRQIPWATLEPLLALATRWRTTEADALPEGWPKAYLQATSRRMSHEDRDCVVVFSALRRLREKRASTYGPPRCVLDG